MGMNNRKIERLPSIQITNAVCFNRTNADNDDRRLPPATVTVQGHFPPVINRRRLDKHQSLYQDNWFRYANPCILKLLYTGKIPGSYFEEQCINAGKEHKMGGEDCFWHRQTRRRDTNLWETKPHGESCRRIEQSVTAARERHRGRLNDIADKARNQTRRTEQVLLKKQDLDRIRLLTKVDTVNKQWRRKRITRTSELARNTPCAADTAHASTVALTEDESMNSPAIDTEDDA